MSESEKRGVGKEEKGGEGEGGKREEGEEKIMMTMMVITDMEM